jgi:hypothetical protein
MRGARTLTVAIVVSVIANVRGAWAQEAAPVGASGVVAPPSTDGETTQSRERAKSLYEAGLVAYRAGRFSDAIDKLLEADRIMPHAAFSYNIALVYEAMKDSRSALRWLRSHVRQSGNEAVAETTFAKVRKFEKELQAQGLQQVTVVSNVAGATVWIDGHALGMTPFTLEIVPGSHLVSVAKEGYEPVQKAFELRADRSMDVEVALVARSSKPSEPTETVSEGKPLESRFVVTGVVTPTRDARVHLRPWTWVSLGVGAALFGGAALFEVKRRNDEDSARGASQADYQSRWDVVDTSKTVSRILLVGGVAVTAAGFSLLTLDLTRRGNAAQASFAPCLGIGACVSMRGRF